jgi:MFS transporter, AAHS family, 3-hydroxyphenylpropionic acid transporter
LASTRPHDLQRISTIACCVVAALCEGFDIQAAGLAASGLSAELHPGAEQLGTFFSASTLGLCIGALVGGRVSDYLGRRPVLIASIILFGLLSVLTAFAWDIESLSWARLLTGAGLGGAFPNLLALVNESSAPTRRQANAALVYGGMPFGGALASLFTMLLAPPHWRWIFIAGGLAPLLLAPALLWLLHESPLLSAQPAAPRSHAGSLGAIFGEVRAMPTLLLWGSIFLGLLLLHLILNWLPTLLVGSGLSKPQAAGVQIAFNVGGGLTALLMGQVLESRLRDPAVVVTFVALPVCVLLLARGPTQFAALVGVAFALGCVLMGALGYLHASAPLVYPTPIRGIGTGVAVAVGRLGSIVGPKLGGALKAAGHGSSQLLSDILPLVVLGSIVGIAFAWSTSRRRAAASDGETLAPSQR